MTEKLPVEIERLIPELSVSQLRKLNIQIVERLKMLHNMDSLQEVAKFKIGDKVSFDYKGQIKAGTIIRLNKKTVSVETDDDVNWNISPHLLRKVIEAKPKVKRENKSNSLNNNNKPDLELVQIFENKQAASRNAPCPCGSGKKYKKCCGA